jgi:hypothetical protein
MERRAMSDGETGDVAPMKRVKRTRVPRDQVVRVTIAFSPDAMAWMEKQAERRATTISELVRRLVDETRGSFIAPPRQQVSRGHASHEA